MRCGQSLPPLDIPMVPNSPHQRNSTCQWGEPEGNPHLSIMAAPLSP